MICVVIGLSGWDARDSVISPNVGPFVWARNLQRLFACDTLQYCYAIKVVTPQDSRAIMPGTHCSGVNAKCI